MQTHATGEMVGANVRAELARQKKSQRELAQVLGISAAGVSNRLNGQVSMNVDELAAVAAYLGVPLSRLIGDAA